MRFRVGLLGAKDAAGNSCSCHCSAFGRRASSCALVLYGMCFRVIMFLFFDTLVAASSHCVKANRILSMRAFPMHGRPVDSISQ